MPPLDLAEMRRPWRLLASRRPWAALAYVVAQVVGGLATVIAFSVIVLLPGWLLVWPRIEPRLLPLTGHRPPVIERSSPLQLRWRDVVLVFISPVAGLGGLALIVLGIGVPVALMRSAFVAARGGAAHVLGLRIDSTAEQVAAVLGGATLLGVVLWLSVAIAYGWGRLTRSLLSDEEHRLTAQLTALSEHHAREADRLALERRHLERDLHDGAQMHLGSAGMRLAMLQLDIERLPDATSRTQLMTSLEDVREQLEEAGQAVRRATRGLVPETLRDGGLCPAVQEAVDAIPLSGTVQCESPRLDSSTETGLFYIVTEALANTVRHAEADRIDVRVVAGDSHVRLDIGDDGRGGAEPTGTGLLGIQARARLMGGEAVVESPPGRGTRITVRVPYRARQPVEGGVR